MNERRIGTGWKVGERNERAIRGLERDLQEGGRGRKKGGGENITFYLVGSRETEETRKRVCSFA